MARTRRIALLMDQSLGFCRNVIRGIRAYGLHKPHWTFRNGPPDLEILPLLREWKPDGIVAELNDRRFATALLQLNKPVVDTSFWHPDLKVGVVDVDHSAVGQLAADYLLSLRLRHFAYFGSASAEYSRIRESGFRDRLRKEGFEAAVCHQEYLHQASRRTSWNKMESQTSRWLRKLPKPVGILVCNDVMARRLSDACNQLGLRIPDEVALLGVDNDELECLLTSPPLSSVAIPGEQIGFEAAKQIDRSIRTAKASVSKTYLPPVRVVARQSTETMAVADSDLIAALQYIRDHVAEKINVADVCRSATVSRRVLERKFRSILGRTVLQELLRVRIQHTQELLSTTNLPMSRVAKMAGFSSAHRLAIVFHRLCGLPPTDYRRRSQLGGN
jgi:LacI family transcriptional regulator